MLCQIPCSNSCLGSVLDWLWLHRSLLWTTLFHEWNLLLLSPESFRQKLCDSFCFPQRFWRDVSFLSCRKLKYNLNQLSMGTWKGLTHGCPQCLTVISMNLLLLMNAVPVSIQICALCLSLWFSKITAVQVLPCQCDWQVQISVLASS